MKKEGEKGDVGSSDPALCAIGVSTRGQNLVFGVGQCFESPRQKKTFGFLCQGGISELTKEKEKEKGEERERKRSGQERKRRGRGEQHKTSRKKKASYKVGGGITDKPLHGVAWFIRTRSAFDRELSLALRQSCCSACVKKTITIEAHTSVRGAQ